MSNRLQRPPTIRDIAREAGVSTATISRVLNGRPSVSAETRERVLRVIREQGYSSNPTARALSGGRTGLVGVAMPMVNSSYFSTLAGGVADALATHDLHAVLCTTRHEHDREIGLLERLMHGATEGAVLILPSESAEELAALADRGFPFVVLDPKTPLGPGTPAVSAANGSGAGAATRHLLELGHTRIAAITGPAGWCATEERLTGYRAELARAGLGSPELVVEADFEVAGGRAAADRLLELAEPPTAIVAFNDNLAVGAYQAARARGLELPDDLSVVGFDDADHAALVRPALTTVRQPLLEMSRMAVELLMRMLAGDSGEGLRIELETRLVVRQSTSPVRGPVSVTGAPATV